MIEIVGRQAAKIIKPFLKELEFVENCGLVRWWPLGDKRGVVVDPARNFGRPISDAPGGSGGDCGKGTFQAILALRNKVEL